MRNTNKYTKLYSGGIPVFVEENIFEIIIPMNSVAGLQVGPKRNKKENSKENSKEINRQIIVILKDNPEITLKELAKILGMTVSKVRYHIEIMKKSGILEHTGATKKGKWIIHK